MSLFSNLFKRKKYRCTRCERTWGDGTMQVVEKVDCPVDWSNPDTQSYDEDVIYEILKCKHCGKYAVVGSNPLQCHWGHYHDGVLVTDKGDYVTYCTKCMALSKRREEPLCKDEKGYYIQHYVYWANGTRHPKGITRVWLKETLSFSNFGLAYR